MQLPDTFHTKVKGVDTLKNNGRCSGRIVVATGVVGIDALNEG